MARHHRRTPLRITRHTHADAYRFAEGVAGYARRIRIQNDINRIHASLDRIKENR